VADLTIKDLVIEYTSGSYKVRPIDGLDLDLLDGQLVLLLGASGCGKTTLLSAMASILKPTAGSIRVGPQEVTTLTGDQLQHYRQRTVGIVFQAFNLVPSLSALENVQVPMWASGVPARDARRKAAALLDRVGMSDRVKHKPGDLSGGQQQRVAIARALANDPPLLLADEPTAHLDYIQVEGILRLLRELASPGRLLVIATHDERLLPLADRVVALTPSHAPEPKKRTRKRKLAKGDVLFRQGDDSDLVYVVDDGTIEITRELADGGEELLAELGAGSYFGELGPLFGLRRSATARAASAATVTGLTVASFRERAGDSIASVIASGATD
jgi:putative ABC transport system ATP-binding protein